jgi:hypothetical protein
MKSDRAMSANAPPESPPERSGPRTELEGLRATCRQQAAAIDALSEAVSMLHRGAVALKAENIELRAELGGLRRYRSAAVAAGRLADGELVEVMVALDTRAPGAARNFVVQCLTGRSSHLPSTARSW